MKNPWNKHEQGICPVSDETIVDIVLGDDYQINNLKASDADWDFPEDPITKWRYAK